MMLPSCSLLCAHAVIKNNFVGLCPYYLKNNVVFVKRHLNKLIFDFYEPKYSNAIFLKNAHP